MDTVKFNNRDYKIREIKLPKIGEVMISTIDLNNALLNDRNDYISKQAQNIDEQMYYFVEQEEIELSEKDLVKLISLQTICL